MTPQGLAVLTDHQRAVAERVIAHEERQRTHVVVSLSGAHAYGFPSPDSDLDVKAVHFEPTANLLGFPRVAKAAERLEIVDGVEMDYSSNELGPVLQSVLKGNGNAIERFLSGYVFTQHAATAALTPLIQRSLSRKVFRHYAGFAAQQRAEWEKTERRSAKKLLYVLRTTLTGAHLLGSGEVVTDVTRLLSRYGWGDALELIEQKRRGEKSELSSELGAKWAARVPHMFAALDRAHAESKLPVDSPNAAELEAWLIAQRLEWLHGRPRS